MPDFTILPSGLQKLTADPLQTGGIALNSNVTITDAHITSSAAHGTTGAIVGTSDAQTLTSKTIDYNSNTLLNFPGSLPSKDARTGSVSSTWVLSGTPVNDAALFLFKNGLLQTEGAGNDYQRAGAMITFLDTLSLSDMTTAVYWQ